MQLPPSFAADISDFDYFRVRPHASIRNRLPFDGELPPEIWKAAAAAGLPGFVIVKRGAPGEPWIRSRKFVFAAGGTAWAGLRITPFWDPLKCETLSNLPGAPQTTANGFSIASMKNWNA
jgi:hypothetical protein